MSLKNELRPIDQKTENGNSIGRPATTESRVNRRAGRLFFISVGNEEITRAKKIRLDLCLRKNPPKRKQETIRVLSGKKGGGEKIRKKLLEATLSFS